MQEIIVITKKEFEQYSRELADRIVAKLQNNYPEYISAKEAMKILNYRDARTVKRIAKENNVRTKYVGTKLFFNYSDVRDLFKLKNSCPDSITAFSSASIFTYFQNCFSVLCPVIFII